MEEGVIQFAVQHEETALGAAEIAAVESLLGWRSILRDCGVLGAEPGRYGGLGFGNVSTRVSARALARGHRAFVVSGTQTSGLAAVGPEHFVRVSSWSVPDNSVRSAGQCLPSSEALTHATIYDQGPHLTAVLHVHSPDIWRAHRRLRLPTTPAEVDYGTVAMADAAGSLFRAGRVLECQAFVMLGHEDGVVAFGRSVDDAGTALVRLLAAARC